MERLTGRCLHLSAVEPGANPPYMRAMYRIKSAKRKVASSDGVPVYALPRRLAVGGDTPGQAASHPVPHRPTPSHHSTPFPTPRSGDDIFADVAAMWKRWVVVLDPRSKAHSERSPNSHLGRMYQPPKLRVHQVCSPGGFSVFLNASHIVLLVEKLISFDGGLMSRPLIVAWSTTVQSHVDFYTYNDQGPIPSPVDFRFRELHDSHSRTAPSSSNVGSTSGAASSSNQRSSSGSPPPAKRRKGKEPAASVAAPRQGNLSANLQPHDASGRGSPPQLPQHPSLSAVCDVARQFFAQTTLTCFSPAEGSVEGPVLSDLTPTGQGHGDALAWADIEDPPVDGEDPVDGGHSVIPYKEACNPTDAAMTTLRDLFVGAFTSALPAATQKTKKMHISALKLIRVGNARHRWFSLSCHDPRAHKLHGMSGFSFFLGVQGAAFVDYVDGEGGLSFARLGPGEPKLHEKMLRAPPGNQLLLLDMRTPHMMRCTAETVGSIFLRGFVTFGPQPGHLPPLIRVVTHAKPMACELCRQHIFNANEILYLDPHPQHVPCLVESVFLKGLTFCQVHGHEDASGPCFRPLPMDALVNSVMLFLPAFLHNTSVVRVALQLPLFVALQSSIKTRLIALLGRDDLVHDFDPNIPWTHYEHCQVVDVNPWDDSRFTGKGFNYSHVRIAKSQLPTCLKCPAP